MAITPPSTSDFKARYPEFAQVSDELVNLVLTEAAGFVAETWREADRAPAIMALAAHMLAIEGEPQRSTGGSGGASTVSGPVQSAKVGDVSVTFKGWNVGAGGGGSSGPISDSYVQTAYGQRFLTYLRRNFPAVVVV